MSSEESGPLGTPVEWKVKKYIKRFKRLAG